MLNMSRFETSKFVRNQSIMRIDCLIEACEKMSWKYKREGDTLFITDINAGCTFGAEYAIKVQGDQVTYNTYYLGNTKEYVDKLKSLYDTINVEYSKTAVPNNVIIPLNDNLTLQYLTKSNSIAM